MIRVDRVLRYSMGSSVGVHHCHRIRWGKWAIGSSMCSVWTSRRGSEDVLPLHLIPHRHRPGAELLPAHELEVHHLG